MAITLCYIQYILCLRMETNWWCINVYIDYWHSCLVICSKKLKCQYI